MTEPSQNIFFKFDNGDPPTDAPTSSPTPEPLNRDINYRLCAEDDNDDVDGVADIHFVYDIETTRELTRNEENNLLDALETAMINSIYTSQCNRRRLEIHSISSGARDEWQSNDCIITTSEATLCSRYDGSIKVAYSERGENASGLESGNSALTIVATDMMGDKYLDVVNQEFSATNSTVMRISYIGTSFYNTNQNPVISGLRSFNGSTVEEGGLTSLGKGFIPVLALLFLASVLAMFLGYKSNRRQKRLAELAVFRAKNDNEYLRKRQEEIGPFDADVQELALHADNQDVHRCNKAECIACSHQPPAKLEDEEKDCEKIEEISEKIEIESTHAQSVISGITNPFFGGWYRTTQQVSPHIRILDEDTDSESQEVEAGAEAASDKFEDEPPGVTFVRVNSKEPIGVSRKYLDFTGTVRNELEL